VLFFNWAPRNKGVLGECRYRCTHPLTSTLDGDEWSASRTGRFTLRERAPSIHWIGGWIGPRAGLNAVVKRRILSPSRGSKPHHLARSPTLYHWASYPSSIYIQFVLAKQFLSKQPAVNLWVCVCVFVCVCVCVCHSIWNNAITYRHSERAWLMTFDFHASWTNSVQFLLFISSF
jgi:hypothetical protein